MYSYRTLKTLLVLLAPPHHGAFLLQKKKINGGGIQVHTQAQKIQVVSDPVTSLISAGLGLLLLFSLLPSSFDHPFHGPHAKPYKRHPSSAPNLPTCSLRTCLSISFLLHRIQFSDDEAKR
jgi:hypothetical protein